MPEEADTDSDVTRKRDEMKTNDHRALDYCLSIIFSENRSTLFRIMLQEERITPARLFAQPSHSLGAAGEFCTGAWQADPVLNGGLSSFGTTWLKTDAESPQVNR
ncbi:hypothetical protein IVB15_11285 [Bradyrhizobium sp. 182]|uniref:hypothetical protein n=1 Tax=unclassified Bradyrhizobium TaxID=2631580 RepID=UPI001FFB0E23|nr:MULTISPECIES: hypothetical protein [unclassified Bradyrhizobium]MCK1423660.1 hypothetical protein [Bradyrhizobium sp. CW12]MCK1528299.1 hypothetical protein [Bradyrhizobium sp. 182]MCK1595121.1 hypothetical protein [Bradyrhizobium sp. 164]MCK1620889.1 hypothetical protein [Bradyrhizobium sp. 159]MCK1643565.1 hypothetical protein [Bradyrhizobium sp. 154]